MQAGSSPGAPGHDTGAKRGLPGGPARSRLAPGIRSSPEPSPGDAAAGDFLGCPGPAPPDDKEILVAESYSGEAYCVKCKEKREFTGEVKVSDSGRRMAQGICGVCGTKLNRILGKA